MKLKKSIIPIFRPQVLLISFLTTNFAWSVPERPISLKNVNCNIAIPWFPLSVAWRIFFELREFVSSVTGCSHHLQQGVENR